MYPEFCRKFLTALLKSTCKSCYQQSMVLPWAELLFRNLDGSNRSGDVKLVVFGFVILCLTLPSSINKHLPLNSTAFNFTNSSQTCFGAVI